MMNTPLCQQQIRWGGLYALCHFLILPSAVSLLCQIFLLPGWAGTVILTFLGAVCSILIYRRFLLDSWKSAVCRIPTVLAVTAAGTGLYFGSTALYTGLILSRFPAFYNFNDTQVLALLKDGGLPVMLSVVLAAPIVEETVFRGLLFRGLCDRSPIAAWCLSVGLFALSHVAGYWGQFHIPLLLLVFCQYIPAGICLALAYRLSGTFVCPVLIHALINLIGVLTAI